jgi:glucose-1-phosphate thymidylyltransferase
MYYLVPFFALRKRGFFIIILLEDKNMKGVILAGGSGTRMRPITKVVNKLLVPVCAQEGAIPMIFYPITTLVRSGVEDILIVSSRRHCGQIIEHLGDGYEFGANFTYKIQDIEHVPMGIASALKLAKDFTRDEPFATILGDNFFEDSFEEEFTKFEKAYWGLCGCDGGSCECRPHFASIFLKQVPDPERFGVYTDGKIVEKPKEPKSDWAVTGLYLYTKKVYEIAEKFQVSARGELEITDINDYCCGMDKMAVNRIQGFWSDMGVPVSLARTQEFIEKNEFKSCYVS